jgi:hypothetical protein
MTDTAHCPTPDVHGNPFRYCPNCDWTEPVLPRDPDLAAMAAYEAFCAGVADRLGGMPRWDQIGPQDRADWRAVADAVVMITEMRGTPMTGTPAVPADAIDAAVKAVSVRRR